MSKEMLLGIDIGTSGCKLALFYLNGDVVCSETVEYPIYYPQAGFVEQNPNDWWDVVCVGTQRLLVNNDINVADIAGVGVDGQSWSCIPVANNGELLCNTPIWMDTRAQELCEEAINRIGHDRIYSISKNPFMPSYTTPKILWFKKYKPDIYQNTYKFLQSNSYIVYKLTGKLTQDTSQGYGLHMFDMKTGQYDESLCEELQIDQNKLPDIYKCHDIVGFITDKAAKLTGLKKNTPVVAGGLDAACGALGAGVVYQGQTQEQGGQAGGMSICMNKAIGHTKLILGQHVVPGRWLLQGGTVGGGGTLNWFKREFCDKEIKPDKNTFELLSDQAGTIPVGSNGLIFLPYMAGERSPIWDENAKGVYFGLSYNKTRKHMIRAMMEGCAYSVLHNIETAKEAGVEVSVFNSIGGSTNSHIWTQIKSDVTGKPINVPESDTATALGAALLAGVGTGLYKDFECAIDCTFKIKRRHEPDNTNHELYKEYYKLYLQLYKDLKETMKKINNIK